MSPMEHHQVYHWHYDNAASFSVIIPSPTIHTVYYSCGQMIIVFVYLLITVTNYFYDLYIIFAE